jgi:uncharacterized protein
MSPTKTALITGASNGIGYELSKLFAADGYNLVLVARSESKMETLAQELRSQHGISVTVLAKDLSVAGAANDVFDAAAAQKIQVDVLVNNAGFGIGEPFTSTRPDDVLQMLQLNVVSLTVLTHLFLPGMAQRKSGRILNVGSTGSFSPVANMAVYGATKAYVLSFSEALTEELRGTGVSVTALCPGVTITGFQARAGLGETFLHRISQMTAKDVARIGYQAMQRGKAVVVPGFINRLMIESIRFTPRVIVRQMTHRLMNI